MSSINELDLQQFLQTAHKTPNSKLLLVWLGGLLLSLAAASYLIWMPKVELLRQGNTKLTTELSKLEADMKTLVQLAELEAELTEYRQLLPRLQGALPQGREVPELLRSIYTEIGRNQLLMLNFEPQAEQDTGVLTLVPVKLSASGAGASVAKLPLLVSALTRKAAFNEFNMKRDEKSGEWHVEGSLVAFAQPKALAVAASAVVNQSGSPALTPVNRSKGVSP